jgi:hypothetical protein
VEQGLAVNSRMTPNDRWRTMVLLLMCALVFLFALRAKTASYNGDAPPKVTPSTSSKLWRSSQKMEVQAVDGSAAIMFWMVAACFFGLFRHPKPLLPIVLSVKTPSQGTLQYLHRFLRPPPFLA